MTEASAGVWRDGRLQRVPSAALVRGDVLVLAEGDAVGADARLLQAAALRLLEASLTGESESVLKDPAVLPAGTALGDRLNMVFKGTAVAQGSGRALVTGVGMQTEVGQIATLLDATPDVPTPLQTEVARLGRALAVAAVLIALGVVAVLLLVGPGGAGRSTGDVLRALLLGVSLAVAAVPEGLPAILSVVLALGVQRMAQRQAIVKQPASVETLGSATVIATDKTGTLTRAEMTVQQVVTLAGGGQLSGTGYTPEGALTADGAALADGPLFDAVAMRAQRRRAGQRRRAAPGRRRQLADPGRPHRSRVAGGRTQAGADGGAGAALPAPGRDPVQRRAQAHVGAGERCAAGRRAGADQQGCTG